MSNLMVYCAVLFALHVFPLHVGLKQPTLDDLGQLSFLPTACKPGGL